MHSALPSPTTDLPQATGSAGSARPTTLDELAHLALLRVTGPDAIAFLDAQLTRNVPPAPTDGGPMAVAPAGYCSPKGRLLATFTIWNDGSSVHLIVSRDIAAAIARRLRMYVLRAKVTIDDAGDSHALVGWADAPRSGDGAGRPGGAIDRETDLPAIAPWQAVRTDAATDVRYPDATGRRRFLRVRPAADGEPAPLSRSGADAIDAATWRWLDIRAGLPWVGAATQDRFVPQMLNLEALGGVDFRKGCFPGQEVVARSQYLGKLKRRTALASLDARTVPDAGVDLWQPDGREPCGVVVSAERGPDQRIALLAELPLALFDGHDVRVGAPDGPGIELLPLPYALPDNEVFVRPKL